MKMKVPLQWVDSEILRLKTEFDEILRRRSFLTDRRDLRLCLFLPELVAARYLGLRQREMSECRVGTNVFFGKDGSVRFRFTSDDYRPRGARDFTFSREYHGEIDEVVLLMAVLTGYKRLFLDVIRSQNPQLYEEVMGEHFFGKAAASREVGLIEPHTQGVRSGVWLQDGVGAGCGSLGERFRSHARTFLEAEGEGEDPSAVNLASVRLLAYRWMYEVHDMSVEEIARLLGDSPETVIRVYASARFGYSDGHFRLPPS